MGSDLHRRATRALAPSRAEMARRHAPSLARDRLARSEVREAIDAGSDPDTLYRGGWCDRGDGEDMRRARSAVLLGVLRRGLSTLD
jgi:hypothetical protein